MTIAANEITLNEADRSVVVRGKTTKLTDKAFRILACLVENPNKLCDISMLALAGWGDANLRPNPRPPIRKIRKAVEVDPAVPRLIVTAKNKGVMYVPSPNLPEAFRIVKVGNLTVDFDSGIASVDGTALKLLPAEARMLDCLCSNIGCSYQALSLACAGISDASSRTVFCHLRRLKKELESAGVTAALKLIRGYGYKIVSMDGVDTRKKEPGLILDDERSGAWFDGEYQPLGFKQHALLSLLAEKPGELFTKPQIALRLWGEDNAQSRHRIRDVTVNLRAALSRFTNHYQVSECLGDAGYALEFAENGFTPELGNKLRVDDELPMVEIGGKRQFLPPLQHHLLKVLCRASGYLSWEQLATLLGKEHTTRQNITSLVQRVQQRLPEITIDLIRGRGYRLIC